MGAAERLDLALASATRADPKRLAAVTGERLQAAYERMMMASN